MGSLSAKGFDELYDKWGKDAVDWLIDVGKTAKDGIEKAVSGVVGLFKSAFS